MQDPQRRKALYAEHDASIFNGPQYQHHNTWINLGYWDPSIPFSPFPQAYSISAKALATRVGRRVFPAGAGARDPPVVLDVGCGLGDTLRLWRDEFKIKSKIIGVNMSAKEVEQAKIFDDSLDVRASDAIAFLRRFDEGPNYVVSVDAAYHFQTRKDLFQAAQRAQTKKIALSDICASAEWTREYMRRRDWFLARWWKLAYLKLVSVVAGAPMENITQDIDGIREDLKSAGFTKDYYQERITDFVLQPFARHCLARADLPETDFKTRWVLRTSAWFMRRMATSGAFEVYIYSASSAS